MRADHVLDMRLRVAYASVAEIAARRAPRDGYPGVDERDFGFCGSGLDDDTA